NNLVKHSQAEEAKLSIKRTSREIELRLTDNGKGFSLGQQTAGSSGFGLKGLSERAHMLGGKLSVESIPGRGTTIRLVIEREIGRRGERE
ncbi:MAG TPA: ATP-binding protein, partial [Pyrinomonadaceae bacterium]|nr:ATP-binding protein [Pyrinomonadaceae bacterium]